MSRQYDIEQTIGEIKPGSSGRASAPQASGITEGRDGTSRVRAALSKFPRASPRRAELDALIRPLQALRIDASYTEFDIVIGEDVTMAFDDATRGRLQRFVAARALLTEEFTRQLQQDYGLDPSTGDVASLESLAHLDDRRLETARILREILAHYLASEHGQTGTAQMRRARPHGSRAGLYHPQSACGASHDGGARHPV